MNGLVHHIQYGNMCDLDSEENRHDCLVESMIERVSKFSVLQGLEARVQLWSPLFLHHSTIIHITVDSAVHIHKPAIV